MANPESKIIYQETNPYSSLTAFLEDDGRTVYMYLQSEYNPEWSIKSVWVKNRIPTPEKLSLEDMRDGYAPILSSEYTDQTDTSEILANDVYFIWTEEGDGVALFVRDELFAFIPSWSGINGFHGYSKFVQKEAITAFPLGNSNHGLIYDRIEDSRRFWEFRAQKYSWKTIQGNLLGYLESKMEKHSKYWSADGGKFPYIGIAKFQPTTQSNLRVYSTIGLSGQNMPRVELYHRTKYLDYVRVEIVIAIETTEEDDTERWVPHLIGELVGFPWKMIQWYGHGHTISMSRRDPQALLEFTTLLLLKDLPNNKNPILDLTNLKSKESRPINFLYALPITEEEKVFIQTNSLEKFIDLWKKKGNTCIHNSYRESVIS